MVAFPCLSVSDADFLAKGISPCFNNSTSVSVTVDRILEHYGLMPLSSRSLRRRAFSSSRVVFFEVREAFSSARVDTSSVRAFIVSYRLA